MKKHSVDIRDISKEVLEQLQRGAFLTVKTADVLNTMTIGWGQIGIMWGQPVFVVPVRLSRYTCELLYKTDEFSVSVPRHSDMIKELAFCGNASGRDTDKFKVLDLAAERSDTIETPIIGGCRFHIECRVLARIPLGNDDFKAEFKEKFYANNNFHVLFYGEIRSCYMTDV
jgi:flavin reductase (DIM6/NTAB) family NADH-FMN oxidoreductase RutF